MPAAIDHNFCLERHWDWVRAYNKRITLGHTNYLEPERVRAEHRVSCISTYVCILPDVSMRGHTIYNMFIYVHQVIKLGAQWIWLRNLSLRTAESRPSCRASMSAADFSPQSPKIQSKFMSRVYKILKKHKTRKICQNNQYLEVGLGDARSNRSQLLSWKTLRLGQGIQ